MAKDKIQPGARIGKWTIVGEKSLGEGGNSVVWQAVDDDGQQVAIKFLFERHIRTSRYQRFKHEVEFHRLLTGKKGILPLIDASLPDAPSATERPWLATQLATTLKSSLAEQGNELNSVIQAVYDVAQVLVDIHEQGAAHRDIKPDNIFFVDGGAALGDFGLVDYPGKDDVTSTSERMGPIFYVAPEMMEDTEGTDPRPSDVYSLAKTLWVLATGQNYPFAGQMRTDIISARLSTYVRHERAVLLDRLLDKATRHSPSDRPTMADFAAELSAWLHPQSLTDIPDLSYLSSRFQSLHEQEQSAKALYNQRMDRIDQMLKEFGTFLQTLSETVKTATGLLPTVFPPNTNHIRTYVDVIDNEPDCVRHANRSMQVTASPYNPFDAFVYACGFVAWLMPDGSVIVQGVHGIGNNSKGKHIVHTKTIVYEVGSVSEQNLLTELMNDITTALPHALTQFAGILEDPSVVRWR